MFKRMMYDVTTAVLAAAKDKPGGLVQIVIVNAISVCSSNSHFSINSPEFREATTVLAYILILLNENITKDFLYLFIY